MNISSVPTTNSFIDGGQSYLNTQNSYLNYNPISYPSYPVSVPAANYSYQSFSPANFSFPQLKKPEPVKATEKSNSIFQKNTEALERISQNLAKLQQPSQYSYCLEILFTAIQKEGGLQRR